MINNNGNTYEPIDDIPSHNTRTRGVSAALQKNTSFFLFWYYFLFYFIIQHHYLLATTQESDNIIAINVVYNKEEDYTHSSTLKDQKE